MILALSILLLTTVNGHETHRARRAAAPDVNEADDYVFKRVESRVRGDRDSNFRLAGGNGRRLDVALDDGAPPRYVDIDLDGPVDGAKEPIFEAGRGVETRNEYDRKNEFGLIGESVNGVLGKDRGEPFDFDVEISRKRRLDRPRDVREISKAFISPSGSREADALQHDFRNDFRSRFQYLGEENGHNEYINSERGGRLTKRIEEGAERDTYGYNSDYRRDRGRNNYDRFVEIEVPDYIIEPGYDDEKDHLTEVSSGLSHSESEYGLYDPYDYSILYDDYDFEHDIIDTDESIPNAILPKYSDDINQVNPSSPYRLERSNTNTDDNDDGQKVHKKHIYRFIEKEVDPNDKIDEYDYDYDREELDFEDDGYYDLEVRDDRDYYNSVRENDRGRGDRMDERYVLDDSRELGQVLDRGRILSDSSYHRALENPNELVDNNDWGVNGRQRNNVDDAIYEHNIRNNSRYFDLIGSGSFDQYGRRDIGQNYGFRRRQDGERGRRLGGPGQYDGYRESAGFEINGNRGIRDFGVESGRREVLDGRSNRERHASRNRLDGYNRGIQYGPDRDGSGRGSYDVNDILRPVQDDRRGGLDVLNDRAGFGLVERQIRRRSNGYDDGRRKQYLYDGSRGEAEIIRGIDSRRNRYNERIVRNRVEYNRRGQRYDMHNGNDIIRQGNYDRTYQLRCMLGDRSGRKDDLIGRERGLDVSHVGNRNNNRNDNRKLTHSSIAYQNAYAGGHHIDKKSDIQKSTKSPKAKSRSKNITVKKIFIHPIRRLRRPPSRQSHRQRTLPRSRRRQLKQRNKISPQKIRRPNRLLKNIARRRKRLKHRHVRRQKPLVKP